MRLCVIDVWCARQFALGVDLSTWPAGGVVEVTLGPVNLEEFHSNNSCVGILKCLLANNYFVAMTRDEVLREIM